MEENEQANSDSLMDLTKRLDVFENYLKNQTQYLYYIKNHFVPEEVNRREKRWKKYIAVLAAKICLIMGGLVGAWDLISWYVDYLKVRHMASRYAKVAYDIYYNENNPEVALTFINRAIELHENHPEYRYMHAYINGMASVRRLLNLDRPYTKSELDDAHQALAQAIFLTSLYRNRAEPYILKGQIYSALKEYDKALTAINRAISINHRSDYAYVRLGTLYAERKEISKSLEAFDKALKINPKSKWSWLWKGVVLTEQNDITGARAAYQKALDLDERFDMAWYNYGMTWIKNERNYEKLFEMMEKAISINPNYKEAYYAIGMAYGYQNRYEIAKVYLDKAIAIDNTFVTALKWRGIVWGELGKFEEALSDFNTAIELYPKNAELYMRRAKSFERLGQLDNAICDLRFSLELNPNQERTLLYLGNVFLKAGEYTKSLDYFDKALAVKSDYDEVYGQKAKAYAALNQIDKAIDAVCTALKMTSYQPERFFLQRGKLYESAKRNELALADYIQARTLRKDYAEAWLSEANILKKLNRIQEAIKAVNTYIDLKPQDKEAQELKNKLLRNKLANKPISRSTRG